MAVNDAESVRLRGSDRNDVESHQLGLMGAMCVTSGTVLGKQDACGGGKLTRDVFIANMV